VSVGGAARVLVGEFGQPHCRHRFVDRFMR
jgi:hypothetical protein